MILKMKEKFKIRYYKVKGYAHFDSKLRKFDFDTVFDYINKKDKVIKHSFYPFIYDEISFRKYNKKKNVLKPKSRPISYASHIDRSIYQYYNMKLACKYEKYLKKIKLERHSYVAIAYRSLNRKSNIDWAKEAFDFIKEEENCIVYIGDFEGFYDNLNHKYLKQMLCKILNVDRLEKDYYQVFKSLTKYTSWKMESLLSIKGLIRNLSIVPEKDMSSEKREKNSLYKDKKKRNIDTNLISIDFDISYIKGKINAVKQLNESNKIFLKKELRAYKNVLIKEFKNNYKTIKKYETNKYMEKTKKKIKQFKQTDWLEISKEVRKQFPIFINKDDFGIPQGSPLSATLSNIYMIDFDVGMNEYAKKYNGKYMRYSDDFIVVIPYENISPNVFGVKLEDLYVNTIKDNISCFIEKYDGLFIKDEKTKVYNCTNSEVLMYNSVNKSWKKYWIDYLGFKYDGKHISLRDSTVSRYYGKLHKKLVPIIKYNGVTRKGSRVSNKNLYKNYTIKGAKQDKNGKTPREKFGNFISYVNRAEKKFGKNEKVNIIKNRHMIKIKKELNKIEKDIQEKVLKKIKSNKRN